MIPKDVREAQVRLGRGQPGVHPNEWRWPVDFLIRA
jgi:hypothetical protein